jgi:hypothetical protein
MTWLEIRALDRRPIVVVEDHLYHISQLLQALSDTAPALLGQTTVVCLERPGPDTEATLGRWLAAWPEIQVAASISAESSRAAPLDPQVFTAANAFCRAVAALLRPGCLLLQDVQLSTLSFLPPERWWESIYLAATVRGMFATRPPDCRFFSNKRGYGATFGRDLIEAGFDPRDVIEKDELARVVVPTLRSHLECRFPWRLERLGGAVQAVGSSDEDRREAEDGLDLVAWLEAEGGLDLGGKILSRRTQLKAGSQEGRTWERLISDRLDGREGLPVLDLGERLAPEGALKAELTNVAARHLHLLRSRLEDPGAIVTVRHAYRLREGLKVGRASIA